MKTWITPVDSLHRDFFGSSLFWFFTFFSGIAFLYKVNILFLMMDMSMLAWVCPQTLGTLSVHANMLRIFPARRPQRMQQPPNKTK